MAPVSRADWGPGGESRALVPSSGNALGPVSYGRSDAFAVTRPRGPEEYRFAVALEAARGVTRRLDAAAQADFINHFEASLSDTAKAAVIDELGAGGPGNVRSATQEQIDDFARGSEAGARCVKSWSGRAARRVGVLLHRTERLARAVSETDRAAIDTWLRLEPEDTRFAIYQTLSE